MNIHDADHDGEQWPSREGQPATAAAAIPPARSRAGRLDLATVSLILIALAVWMLCHPYRGVVHDNRIYALLALNHLDPASFARDVFLRHGSQDSFTVFSPLYAGAITLLGLDWSTKLLVVLGQLLWLLGAFALIRRIMSPPFTWLALLFLAAYPPYYGGNTIFAIGEGFLSPRLYAEAMGLFAIAAFLGSRYWLAGILVILGGVLHPLMAAAPAGVMLVLAALRGRPWWIAPLVIAAGTLVVVAAMSAIHLSGSTLLPRIDPEWKSIVQNRTPQFMLANWYVGDWLMIAGDTILIWLACLRASPLVRQLLVTVLAIGLASLFTSFIAFDLLSDLMTGQTQIWRALWLLHIMAPISLAFLVQDVSSRVDEDRPTLLTFLFAFSAVASLCHAVSAPPLGIPVLLLFAVLYVQSLRRSDTGRTRTLVQIGGGAVLLIIVASIVASSVMQPPGALLLTRLMVVMLTMVMAIILFNALPNRRGIVAGAAVLSVLAGLSLWDMRSAWRRYIDSSPDINAELTLPVSPGELVYWPTDVMVLWGAMAVPSYFSDVQGAGMIFNKGTALDYVRRLGAVAAFEPEIQWNVNLLGAKAPAYHRGWPPKAGLHDLVALCTHADSPDVVVLGHDIEGAKREAWRPRVAYVRPYRDKRTPTASGKPSRGINKTSTYYVYRCGDFGNGDVGMRNPQGPARIDGRA